MARQDNDVTKIVANKHRPSRTPPSAPRCSRLVPQTLPHRPGRVRLIDGEKLVRAAVCPPMQLIHASVLLSLTQEVPARPLTALITAKAPGIPLVIPPLLLGDVDAPPLAVFGSVQRVPLVGRSAVDGGMPRSVVPGRATVNSPLALPVDCFKKADSSLSHTTSATPLAPPEPPPVIVVGAWSGSFPEETLEKRHFEHPPLQGVARIATVAEALARNDPRCDVVELPPKPHRMPSNAPVCSDAQARHEALPVTGEGDGVVSTHTAGLEKYVRPATLSWPEEMEGVMLQPPPSTLRPPVPAVCPPLVLSIRAPQFHGRMGLDTGGAGSEPNVIAQPLAHDVRAKDLIPGDVDIDASIETLIESTRRRRAHNNEEAQISDAPGDARGGHRASFVGDISSENGGSDVVSPCRDPSIVWRDASVGVQETLAPLSPQPLWRDMDGDWNQTTLSSAKPATRSPQRQLKNLLAQHSKLLRVRAAASALQPREGSAFKRLMRRRLSTSSKKQERPRKITAVHSRIATECCAGPSSHRHTNDICRHIAESTRERGGATTKLDTARLSVWLREAEMSNLAPSPFGREKVRKGRYRKRRVGLRSDFGPHQQVVWQDANGTSKAKLRLLNRQRLEATSKRAKRKKNVFDNLFLPAATDLPVLGLSAQRNRPTDDMSSLQRKLRRPSITNNELSTTFGLSLPPGPRSSYPFTWCLDPPSSTAVDIRHYPSNERQRRKGRSKTSQRTIDPTGIRPTQRRAPAFEPSGVAQQHGGQKNTSILNGLAKQSCRTADFHRKGCNAGVLPSLARIGRGHKTDRPVSQIMTAVVTGTSSARGFPAEVGNECKKRHGYRFCTAQDTPSPVFGGGDPRSVINAVERAVAAATETVDEELSCCEVH